MPRPQFTLRALLILMLVVAVAAAFAQYGHRVKVARAQTDLNRCKTRFQEEFSLLESGKECSIDKASKNLDDARKRLIEIRGF